MPREWMLICAQLAMLFSGAFGNAFVARNNYGTISVVGPAFVNREVTLNATPFYPWVCDVEWKYIMDKGTQVQTINGTLVKRYSENGSFFLKWTASGEYNRAKFYAECSANTTIRTHMTSLNMKDIVGQCGAIGLLSPVVLGADVKLGYFPADHYIHHNQSYNTRTWKKYTDEKPLREIPYVDEKVSEYLYILTIFRFNESDEGTYVLNCKLAGNSNSLQLHIADRPSYPVIGPKFPESNTIECIYVYRGSDFYCKTINGTEPVQVVLLLGHDSFILSEEKRNKGLYTFHNVHQEMAGRSRLNVTCQVSNEALETPFEVHGILCSVEIGSTPVLKVPEIIEGENSVAICKVSNAFPAPAIEIRVANILLANVQRNDSFNGYSHMFTSTATVALTNKWNGKEMCCTRTSKYNFGLKIESVCENIPMEFCPTLNLNKKSPLDLPPNKTVVVNCTVDDCNANGLWTLWWEDEHNSIIKTCNRTKECLLTLNYTKEGEKTYKCSARKHQDLLNISLTVLSSRIGGNKHHESADQIFSSTFRFPVTIVLIGTGIFCVLCILLIIGGCVFLKRRKVNEVNTIEIDENNIDTMTDNGMLHIAMEGVQYAVVQRQAATQRIEPQNQRDDDSLAYADLDINFLQEANARVSSRINNTPTEYADIEISSTQDPDKEECAYQNAPDEC
ncbi:uncharacterized protein LOC128235717 [Mya arenaria]|uniref:uncharacterized protein LOC128235717 n=1 Tax=Mya arenaria TaxID=6604 RepID=UPI0022E95691|nr:uncharacterized protein LOC128235717 [Mya arenaria]